jgi:hypothetical protein
MPRKSKDVAVVEEKKYKIVDIDARSVDSNDESTVYFSSGTKPVSREMPGQSAKPVSREETKLFKKITVKYLKDNWPIGIQEIIDNKPMAKIMKEWFRLRVQDHNEMNDLIDIDDEID